MDAVDVVVLCTTVVVEVSDELEAILRDARLLVRTFGGVSAIASSSMMVLWWVFKGFK